VRHCLDLKPCFQAKMFMDNFRVQTYFISGLPERWQLLA